jgi:large subunit ribosomal protein L31e
MAKQKVEENKIELEREYVVPLREKCRVVPRYKKTNKAIRSVKEFLAKHMKVYDRDLDKIKLDQYLNEFLWGRGIKNPPHKVKVKAIKYSSGIVRVELANLPNKLAKKKIREEKIESVAVEKSPKKKIEKKEEKLSEEDLKKEAEEKEKKSAVVEAGNEMEKAASKQMKHQTQGAHKEKTRPKRQALKK